MQQLVEVVASDRVLASAKDGARSTIWIPERTIHDRDARAVYWRQIEDRRFGAMDGAGWPVKYGPNPDTAWQPEILAPASPGDTVRLLEGWRLVEAVEGGVVIEYRRDGQRAKVQVGDADLRGGPSNTRWRAAAWMPPEAARAEGKVERVEVLRAHALAASVDVARAAGVDGRDLQAGETLESQVSALAAAWWDGADGPAGSKGWATWDADPWCWALHLRLRTRGVLAVGLGSWPDATAEDRPAR